MRKLGLAIAAVALVGFMAAPAMAVKPDEGFKGNGLPKISMEESWKVNIHATDHCPGGDFDDTNRRVIVVKSLTFAELDAAHTKHAAKEPDTSDFNNIFLAPGDDFEVTDGNACDFGIDDGGADIGATLLLPLTVASNFDLYVKFRGKPGTALDPVLCAIDDAGPTTWCNVGAGIVIRETGGDAIKFRDYTSVLLNVDDILDVCAGNVCDLFDPALEGWFWDWSATNGAKATLVFIPCDASKGGHAADPTLSSCVF